MVKLATHETKRPVQIFIVEDQPIVRHGLKKLIGTQSDLHICGEAEGVSEAFERLETVKPDIALIDLSLKESNGMELISLIKQHWVGVRMIVISTHDAAIYGPMAMKAGAMGYVSKHEAIDQIVDAIRCVCNGNYYCGKELEDASHWFG